MKRRSANAIEKSQRGKKAEVRKWMLYYDRQEIFEHTNKTKYSMEHDWMQSDNRTKVRGLQRIEEIMQEIVEEENV